ncbi:MAG TPA: hypothetical protein VHI13_03835 [Candidatus Kapabacteria bacterium]|nr:hypothetical protein [Candidatus Kapabacteria bacterium]
MKALYSVHVNVTGTQSAARDRHARHAVCIAAAGLAVRIAIALQPVAWLTGHSLPDDAFYYFTIARNVAAGHGTTFDGLSLTNGFHPLWLALITPLFALVPDRDSAVHAALLLCALLDTATILLLGRYCRRLGAHAPAALIVMAMYAVSPALFEYGGPMNGMETALNVFVTLLFLYVATGIARDGIPNRRTALALGLLAGALLLARTDNAILLLMVAPVTLRQAWKVGRGVSPRRIAVAAIAALVMTLPWFLWCQIRFGSPVQISGMSMAVVARDYVHLQQWSGLDLVVQFMKNLADLLRYAPAAFLFSAKDSPGFVVNLALAVGAAVLVYRERRRNAGRVPAPPVEAAAVAFFAIQTARTIFMRSWYYYAFVPHLLARFAQAVNSVWQRNRSGVRARLVRGTVLAAVAGLGVAGYITVSGHSGSDANKYRAAQELNRIVPEGSIVGAWNAGIVGYYFEHGTVVNLDGVVNNPAAGAIREHRLALYARAAGITWLADEARTLNVFTPYWNDGRASILQSLDVQRIVPFTSGADTIMIGRIRW